MSGVYVISSGGAGGGFPTIQKTLEKSARLYSLPDTKSIQLTSNLIGQIVSYLPDFTIVGENSNEDGIDESGQIIYQSVNFYVAKYEDIYGFILSSTINN